MVSRSNRPESDTDPQETIIRFTKKEAEMIMEKILRQSLEFAESIINTVREPLIASGSRFKSSHSQPFLL